MFVPRLLRIFLLVAQLASGQLSLLGIQVSATGFGTGFGVLEFRFLVCFQNSSGFIVFRLRLQGTGVQGVCI